MDGLTDGPTDGQTLLQRCFVAPKNLHIYNSLFFSHTSGFIARDCVPFTITKYEYLGTCRKIRDPDFGRIKECLCGPNFCNNGYTEKPAKNKEQTGKAGTNVAGTTEVGNAFYLGVTSITVYNAIVQ